MILIMSGAYLSPEFTSLFGQLPQSFLPVGNRWLFHWHARCFGDLSKSKALALPHDFDILDADQEELDRLGIDIQRLPDGLSLGAAIVYAINVLGAVNEPVRILHGDKLCGRLEDVNLDVVFSGTTSEHCCWTQCNSDDSGTLNLSQALPSDSMPRQVLCGYFTFSKDGRLTQCLTAAGYDFVTSLNRYAHQHGLSARACPDWLDFEHVHTHYRSKARLPTERAFNRLAATPLWIRKSSVDREKIEADAHWFELLLRELAIFTSRNVGQEADPDRGASYGLEFLYLSTLSELGVLSNLPAYSWRRIFSCVDELMSRMSAMPAPVSHPRAKSASYRCKTLTRLADFSLTEGLDMTLPTRIGDLTLPSLERIIETVCTAVPHASAADITTRHEGLCYSNILFDP